MAKYRKIPVEIEATQWFKDGDHEEVEYRPDNWDINTSCDYCFKELHWHGWIKTLEGGHIVCPDDWIITGVLGEHYPCKPDAFEKTYELV